MNKISRRHFLHTSIGATTGALLSADQILAEEQIRSYQSGLVTGQPVPMRYQSIPGFLSESQLSPHYTAHYGGALKGYIAADKRLQSGISVGKVIDSSAYGAIQRARTTKADSVILHELYFNGLSAKSTQPSGALLSAITKRFGTFDKWADDFKASARAASG
ncbi:MAG: Fe-Mn family superoxide dismutase [Gammaproteobacteria bacterium]|nr:Fe-Mn family superoxide dismutase [Gammaproteobacteria bacterium]